MASGGILPFLIQVHIVGLLLHEPPVNLTHGRALLMSYTTAVQVDSDLQSFRQDALALAQREAGTPDSDDGVVERWASL